jgi:flagellar hook-basal body complex protein FliE
MTISAIGSSGMMSMPTDFSKAKTNNTGEPSFMDMLSNQAENFSKKLHGTEETLDRYAKGEASTEEAVSALAPMSVEVEAVKAGLDAVVNVPKTLLNMQL